MPLLGFLNALVFGTIDDGVRERLKACLKCDRKRFSEINSQPNEIKIDIERDSSHRFHNGNNRSINQLINETIVK